MIKYKLNCKKCNHSFDSWFANSNEFERIKKLKLLSCNLCHSKIIEKSLMAPTVINNKNNTANDGKKFNKVKSKIKEYQNFIKNYFFNIFFKFNNLNLFQYTFLLNPLYKF